MRSKINITISQFNNIIQFNNKNYIELKGYL